MPSPAPSNRQPSLICALLCLETLTVVLQLPLFYPSPWMVSPIMSYADELLVPLLSKVTAANQSILRLIFSSSPFLSLITLCRSRSPALANKELCVVYRKRAEELEAQNNYQEAVQYHQKCIKVELPALSTRPLLCVPHSPLSFFHGQIDKHANVHFSLSLPFPSLPAPTFLSSVALNSPMSLDTWLLILLLPPLTHTDNILTFGAANFSLLTVCHLSLAPMTLFSFFCSPALDGSVNEQRGSGSSRRIQLGKSLCSPGTT